MTIWRRCPYPPEKTAGRAQHHLAQERGVLDIGSYSIGSAVMVMWPSLMVFLAMSFFTRNLDPDLSQGILILGAIILGIPVLILIHGLFREVLSPCASTANAEKSASRATMANTGLSRGKP
jgi:hypothetical protein